MQDKQLDTNLAASRRCADSTAPHSTYVIEERRRASFRRLQSAGHASKLSTAAPETLATIQSVRENAKKDALRTVSVFRVIMLLGYAGMILWFRSRGGYRPVLLPPVKTGS